MQVIFLFKNLWDFFYTYIEFSFFLLVLLLNYKKRE